MYSPATLLYTLPFLASAFAAHSSPHRFNARTPANDKKAIVQLFEWSWDSVKAECASFIGPAGYGYVLVSPASEHLNQDQWWTDYQVVSYKIQSKRGDRNQFKAMVDGCHKAGVKVIVDVIWNHMAGVDSGSGSAGSSFTHYNYPGIYTQNDFHYCGTPGNDINNWGDQAQLQNCELANLADLKTESETVRQRLAAHGNDLLSLGVDGFRLDAAKHMAPDDVTNILGRLSRRPYITQEIEDSTGQFGGQHLSAGDVQEFRFGYALKSALQNGGSGLTSLTNVNNRGWLASGAANVFVNNHDTERGGSTLSYKSSTGLYTIANVFMLSYPYGTPTVFSGYYFDNNDSGAPNNKYGTCSGASGTNGWTCQHRANAVAGMVGFFNQVAGTNIVNVVTSGNNQLAFGRGNAGFVALNNVDGVWNASFKTSLPNGTYCDVISGAKSGKCTGKSFTVSNGSFQGSVPARGAIAIHIGSKL